MATFNSQVFLGEKLQLGLNIGCGFGGTCFREPYINLDYDREKHLEGWQKKLHDGTKPIYFVIADATKLPFRNEVFDEVYASHILEHFNLNFTAPILREWGRVLKKGGRFKVCVPDFEWCVKVYIGEEKYKDWVADGLTVTKGDGIVYGRHEPIYQILYGWTSEDDSQVVGHKTVFDRKVLKWFMELAGLRNIELADIHSCPYQDIGGGEICLVASK